MPSKINVKVVAGKTAVSIPYKLIKSKLLKTKDLEVLAKLSGLGQDLEFPSKAALLAAIGWRSNRVDPIARLAKLGFIEVSNGRPTGAHGEQPTSERPKGGKTGGSAKWDRLFVEHWWPLWLERTKKYDGKQEARKEWAKLLPKAKQREAYERIVRLTLIRTEGMLDKEKHHRIHACRFLKREDWSASAEQEVNDLL